MGTHSKSCSGLRRVTLLTAGQEYTTHAARSGPCPRNLQPNTGKLKARTSLGQEGECVRTRKEEKSNKPSCGNKKVAGGLWEIASDWPRGDAMEEGQPEEQQKQQETETLWG